MPDLLESHLTAEELTLWKSLNTPAKIQAYLDQTPYSPQDADRSPLSVMRDRLAHCLDGGLFAAAALRRLGFPPLILDMQPDPGVDDDHVLAIFRVNNHYGAVAKSNFVGLRYREPIYRSLRELVLSYFEDFYNLNGLKSLRYYTRPINLATYDYLNWEWSDKKLTVIENRLKVLKLTPLLTREMTTGLLPVDELAYKSGMLGTNLDGVYKPKV
jgi:hypothetical protein